MANDLDILMAAGKGAASGASKGAALGSFAGPVGTAIGAGAGAILGGVSSGLKQNQANNAQQLPVVDPLEAVRLAQLEQTRKNVLTGSDVVTQNAINQVRNVGSAVQGGISRNTGGDVGGTIDALLKAQKNTQAGVNNAVSEGQQRLPYFDSAVGTLSQRIAQRKADLWKINRDQMLAENAQSRKEANLNVNAMVGANGQLPSTDQLIAMLQKRKMQEQSGGLNQVDSSGATNLMGDWSSGMGNPMPTLESNQNPNGFDYSSLSGLVNTITAPQVY